MNANQAAITPAPPAVVVNPGPAPQQPAPEPIQPGPVQQAAPANPDNAAAGNNPRRSFAPRRPVASVTRAPGIPRMLTIVANAPLGDQQFQDVTYKIPSLINFFFTLSMMDTQMANTTRFTGANSDWLPFVSRLYFSVLIYFAVLRAQQIAGALTIEQTQFLDFLRNQFYAETLLVPGPLVPFFEALAACNGPNANYGNVTFGIPNSYGVSQSSHFMFRDRLDVILPNNIFCLDQFMRYIQAIAPVNAVPAPVTLSSTDSFLMDIYGQAPAADAANRRAILNPLARFDVNIPQSVIQSFSTSTTSWRTNLPFDPATNQSSYVAGNNQTALNFAQILGFQGFGTQAHRTYGWFTHVSRIMQTYCTFFRDTTSLGSITTTGIGANYVTGKIDTNPENRAALLFEPMTRQVRFQANAAVIRYDLPPHHNIWITFQHSDDSLGEISEQYGVLCQLDLDWTFVNDGDNTHSQGPMRNTVATGPLEQRLIVRTSRSLNVQDRIPGIITGYYHSTTALHN